MQRYVYRSISTRNTALITPRWEQFKRIPGVECMSTSWYTLESYMSARVNHWRWREGPQLASLQLFEVPSLSPDSWLGRSLRWVLLQACAESSHMSCSVELDKHCLAVPHQLVPASRANQVITTVLSHCIRNRFYTAVDKQNTHGTSRWTTR